MPSSVVRTFTDPDDYAAAIRGTRAEMTVIGRGHFDAKHTQIELHRLRMQRFSDNFFAFLPKMNSRSKDWPPNVET
jgi:hypothetical protein